jgi:hypothetical protein
MLHQFRSLSILALLFVAVMVAACQPIIASAGRSLSAAERHYHEESIARMDLPEVVASAAPAVRQLSAVERHYHLESVARSDLAWPAQQVASVPAAP